MKKSIKDQTTRAFQVGGYSTPVIPQQTAQPQTPQVDPRTGTYQLPGSGISGYLVPPAATTTGYTPYGGAAPVFQPTQFTGAQFQTATEATNLPTFAQTVGGGAGYDELRTYINDAGQIIQIPFKDGRPIYPIPEGYRPIGEQDRPQEQQPTTPTITPTLNQTQVRDEGGGDGSTGVAGVTSVTGRGIFSGTNFNSNTSANQAVTSAYGITGNRGINVGALLGVAAMNPLAALAAVSGVGPSTMAFGNAPTPGAIGTVDKATLEAIANGTIPTRSEDITSQAQAQNALDAAAVMGIDVSQMGHFGYQPGDAVPGIPGAFMDANGIARDVKTGAFAKDSYGNMVYSDIKSMVARLSMSQEERNKEDSRANMEAVSAEMGRQSRAAEERNRARDAEAGRESDDRSGSTGAKEGQGELASSGTSGKGYKGYGDEFQGPHGTGKSPDSPSSSKGDTSGPSAADVGGPPGTPGDPGMGGAAPGGAPGAADSSGGLGEAGQFCLTENMKVKLNGIIDYVTNVNVGDIVGDSVVVEVMHKHMRNGYYVVNGELEITNDHPVLAKAGGIGTEKWTRTDNLVVGDTINGVKVTSLEYVSKLTPTVYIGTEDDRYDVYTEGEVYTVHGQYKNITKQAA